MRLVLSLLFFFCPSGLDDVSRQIQELALSPYIVGEAQRGVVHGITYYASVPQVTAVLRALFPAGGLGPAVEDVVVPEAQLEHQHPYNLPYVTSPPQGTPLAIFPSSAPVEVPETVSKPLVQPACSSSHLDTPDTNDSRIFQDVTTAGDPTRYLLSDSSLVLAGTVVFITTFVLLLLRWTTILLVFDVYSCNVPAPSVIYWFKLFLGVASCGILGNYMDPNPQALLVVLVAGYMLREMNVLRITYIVGRMVRLNMDIRTDLARPGGQTSTNTPEPKANTQLERVMVDAGIQTNSASCPSALKLDSEVQTDTDLGLIPYSPSPTGNLIFYPAPSTMVDGNIQLDVTTEVNPICVLPLTASPVNYEVQTEDLILAKEVVGHNETQAKPSMEAVLLCGLALTMPQVDGIDKLALNTDIPTESTFSVTTLDSCTEELVSTFAKVTSIKDEILTDIINEPIPTSALSLSPPTDVELQTGSTSTSILGHFPRNVNLHLASQGTTVVTVQGGSAVHALKEKCEESKVDEGNQAANTPAPAPSPISPLPHLVTLRNPEDNVIPVVLVKPASVSTPTHPLGTVTQAPSHFASQHPPPFRPPGLGYQPSRQITAGPDPCAQQGPWLTPPALRSTIDKKPIRPRFPTHLQQLIAPPPDHPTNLKNHAIPIGPPCANSSLCPSPGLNHVANPFSHQPASVAIPAPPAVRPFTLPTRDFNAPDPFSRSLTSTPLVPVDSDLNSGSETRSAALRFIPRFVIPVPAGSPVLAARQVLRRFRPLPIPVPIPIPIAEPAAPPPPPTPPANDHPLLKKAPAFWAPPRENSALPVVAPPKKPRVRTRVRSRRMGRDEHVNIEINREEGKDDHVGVAIATAVLDGANDCARFRFHFQP